MVLDKYDNHLDAFGNCGNQLRVEHQVGAVTNHDDYVAVIAHRIEATLSADTTGDFIAHAGEGIFHVVAKRITHAP